MIVTNSEVLYQLLFLIFLTYLVQNPVNILNPRVKKFKAL